MVEILIVMAILGILAGIVIFVVQNSREKARDSERKTLVEQIASKIEEYGANEKDKTTYPVTWQQGFYFDAGINDDVDKFLEDYWGGSFPEDPDGWPFYFYCYEWNEIIEPEPPELTTDCTDPGENPTGGARHNQFCITAQLEADSECDWVSAGNACDQDCMTKF